MKYPERWCIVKRDIKNLTELDQTWRTSPRQWTDSVLIETFGKDEMGVFELPLGGTWAKVTICRSKA